ncbi:ral guanine nucleotide dissociation stimulator-like isoform X1 [Manis pentadactyla]|nr:ral guanine nucleotide dissociation stimulator-like isoform X1 [Manis pentadactyla]XP_057361167.1 ral guanine nucleotide dissociation stimulator-like isoform X1 [Manis pentadactyla]
MRTARETPVLELQPVSPASALGPGAPAGMAPGLAEPAPGPEPTSPCAASIWDIPGVVSGPEVEPHEPSEPSRPSPSPGMRPARRHAWEPDDVTSILHGSQLSSIPEGQALHHLVEKKHLGPTVAELEEPRQTQLAPETQGGPASWLEPVQELPETPVLELRPVSPASAPAEPEDIPAAPSAPTLSPELEPHEPSGTGPRAPAGMAPGLAKPEPAPESILPAFPPRLVAEQLTLMYAELFTKVAVADRKTRCRSQSYNGNVEHLAPAVNKIIKEFNDVANVVICSCLRAPGMTARDRARVVEFWIQVAKECLDLENFASLHAILLALQSPAISRLQCTWGRVSWKSSRIHKRLIKEKWLNQKWLLKEATSMVTQQHRFLQGSEDRQEESTIIRERLIDKYVAMTRHLEPEEHFRAFFQAVEPLDEEESYTLSCQLEPPGQRAGRKGLLFFRSRNI